MKPATEYWTDKHRRLAQREGWDLFTRSDGDLEIERIDEWYGPNHFDVSEDTNSKNLQEVDNPLESDAVATEHIYRMASLGSPLHMLVIHLDCRSADSETWVPEAWRRPEIVIPTAGDDEYRVEYQIDIDGLKSGKTPEQAAREAYSYMSEPGNLPVLDVFHPDGKVTRVDMKGEEDE